MSLKLVFSWIVEATVLIFSILDYPCSFNLWFIIYLVFFLLSKLPFEDFVQFESNSIRGQSNSKNFDWIPLREERQTLLKKIKKNKSRALFSTPLKLYHATKKFIYINRLLNFLSDCINSISRSTKII